MKDCKIWTDQCEAARRIEGQFGPDRALEYLVGEKFLNFLEAADSDPDFRAEIPGFVAAIKDLFERWQLAEYLAKARRTERFDPTIYDKDEYPVVIELERKSEIERSAADLLLVERAMEWLLDADEPSADDPRRP